MEKSEKKLLKKEKEIEKLKIKLKETEKKYQREIDRRKEEIKELEQTIKELRNEKSALILDAEQAIAEKERMERQFSEISDKNKQLLEQIASVGVIKAELKGLQLKLDEKNVEIENLKSELSGRDDEIKHLKEVESRLREEIKQKNEDLNKKDAEIRDLISQQKDASQSIDELDGEIENFKKEIEKLEKIRDEQQAEITKLNEIIQNKDEEIKHLNAAIEEKNQEIDSLNEQIETLKKMNDNLEVEKIQLREGLWAAENGIISNLLPNLIKGDQQALEKIREMLERMVHNAIIGIPVMDLVPEIFSDINLKPTQNLRIITYMDFKNPKHKAIFDGYNKPNISFRNYDKKNLWGIIRDQEELLIAPEDNLGNPIGIVIKDPYQIEILGNVLLNIWAKSKRNVSEYDFLQV
ncbi:MAG: hypothetical protein ACXQS8_04165 [Candidatus Helarchaeales archaeon]